MTRITVHCILSVINSIKLTDENMNANTVDKNCKEYDLMIDWLITEKCNLTCPQCCAHSEYIGDSFAPEVINIRGLKKFLDNSDKIIRISFTGGEPFLVKNFIEALEEITRNHFFSIITNLVGPNVKKMCEKIDPNRSTFIVASAHVDQLKRRNLMDRFLSNCIMVKEAGFNLNIHETAYPFILNRVDEYYKIFSEKGLELNFMPFKGKWMGRYFPEDYTVEEVHRFNLEKDATFSPKIYNQKGMLCMAGYNIAAAKANGDIQPCWGFPVKIGNIYDTINLRNNLTRCPFDFCSCPVRIWEPYLYEKALEEISAKKR